MLRSLSLTVALLAGIAQAVAEERLALVIGNSDYANVGALKNPVNDADIVSASLQTIGFTVTDHRNLDSRGLEEALISFVEEADKAGPEALVLFYYAGHGVQIADVNYLIPVDANPATALRLRSQAVSLVDYMANIDGAGVKYSVIILDACRNNPFVTDSRATTRGLARIDEPTAAQTYIMYSTGAGQVAEDGDGDNSPFSTALAATLAPGLTIDEVGAEVSRIVYDETGQKPWISDGMPHNPTLAALAPDADGTDAGTAEAETPPPATTPQNDPARTAWDAVKDTTSIAVLKTFLARYPDSVYAGFAEARLAELEADAAAAAAAREAEEEAVAPPPPETPPASDEARAAWDAVKDTSSIGVLKAFLSRYPDGLYADFARVRLAELEAAEAARLEREREEAARRAQEEAERTARVDPSPPPAPQPAPAPGPSGSGRWFVILGSFPHADGYKAEERRDWLRSQGVDAVIIDTDDYSGLADGLYAVVLGPYSKRAAEAALATARDYVGDAYIKAGS
jgi:hypothetical protein